MGFNKFLVTESEKKHILNLYGLLKEETPQKKELSINATVYFSSGYHSEKYLKGLQVEIKKIRDFLSSNKGQMFVVDFTVSASESRIPNTDNEMSDKKSNRLNTFELAQKRTETIKNYINKQLESFVKSGLLFNTPTFSVSKPALGETPWVGQKFCPQEKLDANDKQGYACLQPNFVPGPGIQNWVKGKSTEYNDILQQYNKEQFINVQLKVVEASEQQKCLANMSIEVNFIPGTQSHVCNAAVYGVYVSGNKRSNSYRMLVRDDGKTFASLNNSFNDLPKDFPDYYSRKQEIDGYDNNPKDIGGARYNKFILDNKTAAALLADGSTEINVSIMCLSKGETSRKGKCHKGVGNITITNGKNEKYDYVAATPEEPNQITTIVTINPCGQKTK